MGAAHRVRGRTMSVHFGCTLCGRCCHGLRLPLTALEARAWLRDGHDVQILCEAIPWLGEPEDPSSLAGYRRGRSFAADSGALALRVVVILAARFAGACPNLKSDMTCGIYPRRPLVCRIYPAEINPFRELQPAAKACPPEAWAPTQPVLERDGAPVDPLTREHIGAYRALDAAESGLRERVCAALNIDCAAVADEGFIIYSPARERLLAALEPGSGGSGTPAARGPWRLVSHRRAAVAAITAIGGVGVLGAPAGAGCEYFGLRPADGGED